MPVPALRPVCAALLAGTLAACNQTASAPATGMPAAQSASLSAGLPPGVSSPNFTMPSGTGCAGDIARFRAVLKNDADIGHLTQAVYRRASVDLDQADTACAAGRDHQARMIVFSAKHTYGYPY